MNKQTLALGLGLILTLIFIGVHDLKSFPDGAPIGKTGSPNDGSTCASCHGGTARPQANIISSNIPIRGYTPGEKYTITVSVSGNGNKGFSVSPQKTDGTLLGTLAAGSGSKIVSTKWATHTIAKSDNPAVFTFEWTAPAAGTGEVNFYGAFAVTRSNTFTDVLTVNEATATSIAKIKSANKFDVFPNPVIGSRIKLDYEITEPGNVKTTLFDFTGKEIIILENETKSAGNYQPEIELPQLLNGFYLIELSANNQKVSKRILINQ